MELTNAVKDAAASGNTIRGIHLTFAAPAVIEVLAAAELQFIYIDGEHGRFDWRDIEEACIAAERHHLPIYFSSPRGVFGVYEPTTFHSTYYPEGTIRTR